jgi:cell shape-determining protein MreD
MKTFTTIMILVAAFLAVFWASAFNLVRNFLGAQVDLLPALVVYASLNTGLTTVSLVAFAGGLWFDSLSANPLGVSVLPLFFVGLTIYVIRELILRDQVYAQLILGLAASAAVPVLNLLILLTMGYEPLIGWGSLWQWIVMALGGAIATPVVFIAFEWIHRAFTHDQHFETSFRSDREIRRGR